MNRDYFIKVTLAVYKVTELFPEDQLKDEIRKLANEILANLILISEINDIINFQNKEKLLPNLLDAILTLRSYFDLAEAQEWVDPRNFLVLRREYSKIEKWLKSFEKAKSFIFSEKVGLKANETKLSQKRTDFLIRSQERRKKVLEVLNRKDKIKLGELMKIFPDIHRRTLIRDLEGFCRTGLIKKIGNGRAAYYILNSDTRKVTQER